MDILFIKLGALGDVINTLPLAVTLKKQMNAKIHWLVAPLSYPLLSNHTAVDNVILFDKNNLKESFFDVRRQLKEIRFDIALDLQRTLKSGSFTYLSNTERKIGFDKNRCKEMTWLFPFERIKTDNPAIHMLDQYMEFASHLGVNFSSEPEWNIPVFGEKPKNLPEKFIVLNIGATKKANKWLPAYFAKLHDTIYKELGVQSVLTGGPEDVLFSEEIVALCKTKILNYTGKTTVGELTEILRNAEYVISCDTGPMHMAVAVGTKTIGLFGPSTPERTGPYKSQVIKKTIECSPCNNKECEIKEFEQPECMKLITPSDVVKKIVL